MEGLMSANYATILEDDRSKTLGQDEAALAQADALNQFHELQSEHRFWNNRLFRACRQGHLSIEDFRFIFSQYYLYSKNFTRYLAALMANCLNDYHRARLSENLWEEGGGADPEKRHAELFRKFLRKTLAIDLESITYLDSTSFFVREYLDYCMKASPLAASAFLSLGTEGIVAKMYAIFVEGMHKAGIADSELEFFHLHMECDDEHALTLEAMMLAYADQPEWFSSCVQAMDWALTLRGRFFENLYEGLQHRRLQGLIDGIQSRTSQAREDAQLCWRPADRAVPLYRNTNERLNIDFEVERLPFIAEALDPRIVRIPAGKFNEKHRHAHETVFYIMTGEGRVVIDHRTVAVKAGDIVFVPRWAMHQSQNSSDAEMVVLAVTDFGLTGKAYMGDYHKTARMKQSVAETERSFPVQSDPPADELAIYPAS
jgi:pyrroloquinoline quinone (PQQ) biosynthesis protein C/mannose-6-phosphate isomerase-like protein (cupin superfamily)